MTSSPFGFSMPSLASDDPNSYWQTPLGGTGSSDVTLPGLSVTAPGAGPGGGQMTDQQALAASASRLGLTPEEWGGIMHFESGMKPNAVGPGNHIGIIQFGPDEQDKYGVHTGQSFQEQLPAAEKFMMDRGYKPGMGLAQAYSTVNAGSPGHLNASDTANGGTWGTVADKVNYQMGPHIQAAGKWLGGATATMPMAGGGAAQPAGFGLTGSSPNATPFSMNAPMGGATMATPSDTSDSGIDPMKILQTLTGGQGGQGGQQAAAGGGAGRQGGGQKPYQVQAPRPRPFALMKFNGFGGRS